MFGRALFGRPGSSVPRALKMAALEDIKDSAHKIPSKADNRAHEDMPR